LISFRSSIPHEADKNHEGHPELIGSDCSCAKFWPTQMVLKFSTIRHGKLIAFLDEFLVAPNTLYTLCGKTKELCGMWSGEYRRVFVE
jgi:hypothetical protein